MPKDIGGLASVHALLARIAAARRDDAGAKRERDAARRLVAGMAAPDPYLLREIDRH